MRILAILFVFALSVVAYGFPPYLAAKQYCKTGSLVQLYGTLILASLLLGVLSYAVSVAVLSTTAVSTTEPNRTQNL